MKDVYNKNAVEVNDKFRALFENTLRSFNSVKYSPVALELLLGVCATESNYGKYRKQINGPAMGIMQIEYDTAKDVFENYLVYRKDMMKEVLEYVICEEVFNWKDKESLEYELQINDQFSIIMARIIFYRKPESLPKSDDVKLLAEYWKKHYNTYLGKGKVEDFIYKYNKYCSFKSY